MALPPGLSLQQAIFAALKVHQPLLDLLGGEKIYDHMPKETPFPYVTIGQSEMRDWSTASDLGHEHLLRLHVWSREIGSREIQLIGEEIISTLHDASLLLDDNGLVNLRYLTADVLRDPDRKTHHNILRFRAVTEPTI